jgi:hypothetical protein
MHLVTPVNGTAKGMHFNFDDSVFSLKIKEIPEPFAVFFKGGHMNILIFSHSSFLLALARV